MPFFLALHLDPDSDKVIRNIWQALDDLNIESIAADDLESPHVTLAAFAEGDAQIIVAELGNMRESIVGLPLLFASVGFFLTEEAPAFLAVTPSIRLLELQKSIANMLHPIVKGYGDFYEPGMFVPHCTLSIGNVNRQAIIEVVSRFTLPIQATVSEVRLVEIPAAV